MVIYSNKLREFIEDAENPRILVAKIAYNLKEKFGIRVGESEQRSWFSSLPHVARVIKNHDHDNRIVMIEFNVPTTKKRIDFIILGKNEKGVPSAWILELKQWSNVTEEEWNQFRVGRYPDSHPSHQAKDYQFRLQHEMGLEKSVDIKSGAYLHNLKDKSSVLYDEKYNKYMGEAELFSALDEIRLSSLIENHTKIKDGTEAFEFFKHANWKPTEKFHEIVAQEFRSLKLVGSQQIIYDKIENFIKTYKKENKMTFIISGDPGSGKTVVAFKLLMLLMDKLELQIQLMIPGQELRDAYKHKMRDKTLSGWISGSKVWNGYEAAIIDEAHKAIGRDVGKVNYERMYEHLKFAVVFIDNDQVINRKGITKEQVTKIAKNNGHEVYSYMIDENFRNAGERQLLDWIDFIFYDRKTINGEFEYEQYKFINKSSIYKLHKYKNDDEFINNYYKVRENSKSTRMSSLWHKQFYIGKADPDGSVPKTIPIGKYNFVWNPNLEWFNKISLEDKETYSKEVKIFASQRRNFLTGNPHPDYIAYFNHIQGYEFENIFVYIPSVFTYENGEIIFHRDRLAKEVKVSQTWSPASKSLSLEGKDPNALNKRYFLNRIKVMLTRGTKSTHIYAEDKALNDLIYNSIDY